MNKHEMWTRRLFSYAFFALFLLLSANLWYCALREPYCSSDHILDTAGSLLALGAAFLAARNCDILTGALNRKEK